MNWLRLAIIALALTTPCPAPLLAQMGGPTFRLDLSGRGEFEDLFAAGLQPKRFDDQLGICVVKHTQIKFDLGQTNAITIPADECYFKILSDYSLYTIDANTVPLTLDEARQWMLPICRTFGTPDRKLDDFLARVAKGEITRFGWLGDREEDGFGVGMPRQPQNSALGAMGAMFRNVGRDKIHPVEIVVHVGWERPTWKLGEHPPKLAPPNGSEQLSKEPVKEVPEWIRTGVEAPNFVKVFNTPAQIQAMRDKYHRTPGASGAEGVPNDLPLAKSRVRSETTAAAARSSLRSRSWVITVPVLLLLAGAWAFLARR
jgi:hypothetical protein